MTPWTARSPEERGLLNPSFCAALLWFGARGHRGQTGSALPFETAFLVLPMVLHFETRASLPNTIRTSMAVWLAENSLTRSRIGQLSRKLVPFTKEALTFGGLHGLLLLGQGRVEPNLDWRKKLVASLDSASDEARQCMKCAEFIGRWFSRTGSPSTVMALIGVRP